MKINKIELIMCIISLLCFLPLAFLGYTKSIYCILGIANLTAFIIFILGIIVNIYLNHKNKCLSILGVYYIFFVGILYIILNLFGIVYKFYNPFLGMPMFAGMSIICIIMVFIGLALFLISKISYSKEQ